MNIITGNYTDMYELSMSQVYFLEGRQEERAVFDYFFRKTPFKGGYAVFAGLDNLLDYLENLEFRDDDIKFLEDQGFDKKFLHYLKKFKFEADVISSREGDLIFPARPVLRIEGNIIECQIVETLVLNILNLQTLIATKARRMRQVAGDKMLVDFGLRRAHGLGGYHASRASIIGGFDATSNVIAGKDFRIPVSGTMAHSFIQSYEDELTAFRNFAKYNPDNCVVLVDTYDTLEIGVPNAVKTAHEMEKKGLRLKGIRLDSGDLAYLAKKSREMLDKEGLHYVKIAASNNLDEYLIKSLIDQKAPVDLFGVGTSVITGQPDAALDGVYKLTELNGKPKIKLSENTSKVTIPYKKQVFRVLRDNEMFYGADCIAIADESETGMMYHPFHPQKSLDISVFRTENLLFPVMKNGKRTYSGKSVMDTRKYSMEQFKKLPDEFKRFENPHIYKVGLSNELNTKRNLLIKKMKRSWK